MACFAGIVARLCIGWRQPALLLAVLLVALSMVLSACGGGEPGGPAPARSRPGEGSLADAALKAEPVAMPGLSAAPAEVVETTRTGLRSLLAVGPLDDGGHAVAWLGREAADARAPWQLWVQRHDRHGRKAGAPRQLAYTTEPIDPRQIAALVRRDATAVVSWATIRPYQSTLPDLMVSALRARHFGLDGKPRSLERVLDEVLWHRGREDAERFEDLVMAQWRDGRYLVGWTVLDAWNRPACTVQRLAADGRPLAPQDRLGPMAARGLRLLPLEAGGWLATTVAQAEDTVLYANITQVEVRPPIGLPLLPTLPSRSFVLDLNTHGRLLLAGVHAQDSREPPAPWSLWFNPAGREADRRQPLAVLPTTGVALDDGTWIGLWPHAASGRMWAQRFDAHAQPLGTPVLTLAGRAVQAMPLTGGGALLAWVGQGADSSGGTHVFTQRLRPQP